MTEPLDIDAIERVLDSPHWPGLRMMQESARALIAEARRLRAIAEAAHAYMEAYTKRVQYPSRYTVEYVDLEERQDDASERLFALLRAAKETP